MLRLPDVSQGEEKSENKFVPVCLFPTLQAAGAAAHPCLFRAHIQLLLQSCEPSQRLPAHCLWLRLARLGFCCSQPHTLMSSDTLGHLPKNNG